MNCFYIVGWIKFSGNSKCFIERIMWTMVRMNSVLTVARFKANSLIKHWLEGIP